MGKVQSKIIRLEKLLLIEPYKIVGLWSNGETRINDFSKEVNRWKTGGNKELKKLTNSKIFKTAFVQEGTLAFAGSTVRIPGVPEDQPIDFDRRVLYADSELIGRVVTPEDAIQPSQQQPIRRKRQKRSQATQEKIINYIIKTYKKNPKSLVINIGDQFIEVE